MASADNTLPKVASVGINQSLTDNGGKSAGGKAKPNYTNYGGDLKVDRNVDKGNEGGYRKK